MTTVLAPEHEQISLEIGTESNADNRTVGDHIARIQTGLNVFISSLRSRLF